MIRIAEKQTKINKTKVDRQVQSTTFSKEKSNAQVQNRELPLGKNTAGEELV